MITVGYGDIVNIYKIYLFKTPNTPSEKIFTIFNIVITCCVFAYTMNLIGNILSNLAEKT